MKNRQQLSQCGSDQAPVTFIDVAASFTEEEWKLLHHWQKELYQNVMKEIQQTLLSLGPLIATSVFSLRPKEKEDLPSMDTQDLHIKGNMIPSSSHTTVESDVLFGNTSKANQYLKATQHIPQSASCDGPSTGYQMFNSDNILHVEQGLQSSLMDHYSAGGECSAGPSLGHADVLPVVSFRIKGEEESACIDYLNSEKQESITGTTRLEDTTAVTSFGINEEGETYAINVQHYGRRESFKRSAGEGTMKRKSKDGDSIKYAERTLPLNSLSAKYKVTAIPKSEKGTNARSQLWSECSQKLGGEKTTKCDRAFGNNMHSSLHKGSSVVMRGDENSEFQSMLWNSQTCIGEANTQQNRGPHITPAYEKGFSQTITSIERQRTQTELSLKGSGFQCTECDKSFSQKGYLVSHQRTHSGERPYQCTICEKTFSLKHHLQGHQRTHSGERPFQCTQCPKRFSWKEVLLRHQRTHTGERPYRCTKCNESFSWKHSLTKHQRTHTSLI